MSTIRRAVWLEFVGQALIGLGALAGALLGFSLLVFAGKGVLTLPGSAGTWAPLLFPIVLIGIGMWMVRVARARLLAATGDPKPPPSSPPSP